MKKSVIILLLALLYVDAEAQNSSGARRDDYESYKQQAQQEYNAYRTQKQQALKDFRDKANSEFAEFMRQSWESYRCTAGLPVPKSPEPVKPPVMDPQTQPGRDSIPFGKIIPVPQPVVPPQPVAPIPKPQQPAKQWFTFSFYETECRVDLEANQKIVLRDLSEQSIADAWGLFSEAGYNAVIAGCLDLRKALRLCDWGYFQLLKKMSETYYGTTAPNEATLLQMFILTQSGYKVRIAKSDNRLALLIPSDQLIYEYSYFNIAGEKYYVMDQSLKGGSFSIFDHAFPGEQLLSLQMRQPQLEVSATTAKIFVSKQYPDVRLQLSTNKNLMDFYNSYPVGSAWNLYVDASISETLKKDLYPALKSKLAGKRAADAADLLINFVQTAFEYRKDDEQFGYERPLFADETFFYPASDCEDRAILYAILVRELLGLEAVLLHYPGHLATAVHFNEDRVDGDYLMIDGKKYIVCDPTYIGAPVGCAMPQYRNVSATVMKI
jgi:hypothetical protein